MTDTATRITPTELMEAATLLIDALHVCDAEAITIADRINRNPRLDGVQVLEDAETIIRAAANIVAAEIRDGAVHQSCTPIHATAHQEGAKG